MVHITSQGGDREEELPFWLKVKINTPRPKREGSLGLSKPVRTARGPARDSEDMLVHLASRYIGLGGWLLKTDFPATPHRRPPE